MATHAPMSTPRQPFAELSGQRLQHLTSMKNRQNGLVSTPLANSKSPLSTVTNASPISSSTKKRTFEPSPEVFEDFDSENVDPSIFLSPSKKSKSNDGSLKSTPFSFSKPAPMNVSVLRKSFAPSTPPKANISTPRAPNTAPAGRSPPRKSRPFDAKRRTSAPYTRIDPPSSTGRKSTSTPIPFFSLEEALSGSLNRPASVTASPPATAASANASPIAPALNAGMPKAWFFAIHEDSPEQEATNLMEHSATLLDISSDEEGAGRNSKGQDRGKENVAPADFVAEGSAAAQTGTGAERGRKGKGKNVQRRRKVMKVDEMDDGERTPLGEIEREDSFPEGVKEGEVVVVDREGEQRKLEAPVAQEKYAVQAAIVNEKGDADSEIVIFEDRE